MALKNILSNKFRTFLTMLGIIIGVMAVMVIVGLGNGLTLSMKESVSSLGMNLLQVNILGYGTRTVEVDDFYAVVESRPDLFSGISPIVSMTGTVKVGTKTYRRTSVSGVSESYFGMSGASIAQGRLLQYVDCTNYKKVCVVGDYVNRVAYGGNALGQTIKVGADQFTIVGVLKAEVKDPSLQQGSADDYIYLPYTTALRLNRSSVVGSYGITTVSETQVSEGKAVLEAALKKLVGGIGIMNIMMVSVAERTREIGIRKALGAKERSILALFVTEAATTSALGGLIGILLGYLISAGVNQIMTITKAGMTIQPSVGSVMVAFGISVGIGVLFGYLPAKRAARLNPIEALRYD